MQEMRKYYMVTTDHLEKALWFREDADFVVAMNHVATQAALCPHVTVLAFILMSNHLHFVLKGTYAEVSDFVNYIKQRYSQYYRHKYSAEKFLKRNRLDVSEINPSDERLERAIAYVQMNSVAANICALPTQYPWGTGSLFFNADTPIGKRLDSFSKRALKRMLHTDFINLPGDWLINDKGMILPQSYVAEKEVEGIFRRATRLSYFYSSSSKARLRFEAGNENLPAFRDQTILAALPDLLKSLFGKTNFSLLSADDQLECLRQLKYRFSSDVNQLARVCGITYADAALILDRI